MWIVYVTGFVHPEVILCGWEDVKIHLLANLFWWRNWQSCVSCFVFGVGPLTGDHRIKETSQNAGFCILMF